MTKSKELTSPIELVTSIRDFNGIQIALARKVDNKIIVSLGANQGLRKGKVGIVSPNGNDMNMNDWIVVTVKNTNGDFSEIEPLNPNNENDVIEGKFIKFLK